MSTMTVEQLVVGGERVPAAEGRTFEVTDPVAGSPAGHRAGGRQPRTSTERSKPLPGRTRRWGALSPVTRGRHMHRFANVVEEHAEELAQLESRNVGMPISDARGQLGMIVDVIRYYAGAVDKFFGNTVPVERNGVAMTFREPIGVVGLITPWNFPLNIANWKTAPGDGCRQHRGLEAGVADAADGASLRRAGARGRHPRRRAERDSRARIEGR